MLFFTEDIFSSIIKNTSFFRLSQEDLQFFYFYCIIAYIIFTANIYHMHFAHIFTEVFMYIYFYTFGCKVNVYETAAMTEAFQKAGYSVTLEKSLADIFVVNSCTVTSESDSKLMQTLRRIRREYPSAVIVLTGCYPQAFPEKAADSCADVITGTKDRSKVLSADLWRTGSAPAQLSLIRPETALKKCPFQQLRGIPVHL